MMWGGVRESGHGSEKRGGRRRSQGRGATRGEQDGKREHETETIQKNGLEKRRKDRTSWDEARPSERRYLGQPHQGKEESGTDWGERDKRRNRHREQNGSMPSLPPKIPAGWRCDVGIDEGRQALVAAIEAPLPRDYARRLTLPVAATHRRSPRQHRFRSRSRRDGLLLDSPPSGRPRPLLTLKAAIARGHSARLFWSEKRALVP